MKTKCAAYFDVKFSRIGLYPPKNQEFNEKSSYNYCQSNLELYKFDEKTAKIQNCLSYGDYDKYFGEQSVILNLQGYLKLSKGGYLIGSKVYWDDQFFKNQQFFNGFVVSFRKPKIYII